MPGTVRAITQSPTSQALANLHESRLKMDQVAERLRTETARHRSSTSRAATSAKSTGARHIALLKAP